MPGSAAVPRRQFNLPWLVGTSEFAAIRGEYTAWQDRHFEVIEQDAPWLGLVGRNVYETCSGRVPRSPALFDFSPRCHPAVGATRQVPGRDPALLPRAAMSLTSPGPRVATYMSGPTLRSSSPRRRS
jgi:hypothetical protein